MLIFLLDCRMCMSWISQIPRTWSAQRKVTPTSTVHPDRSTSVQLPALKWVANTGRVTHPLFVMLLRSYFASTDLCICWNASAFSLSVVCVKWNLIHVLRWDFDLKEKFIYTDCFFLSCFPLKCCKKYSSDEIIPLNGTPEEVEKLRSRIEERKLKAKLERVSSSSSHTWFQIWFIYIFTERKEESESWSCGWRSTHRSHWSVISFSFNLNSACDSQMMSHQAKLQNLTANHLAAQRRLPLKWHQNYLWERQRWSRKRRRFRMTPPSPPLTSLCLIRARRRGTRCSLTG